MKSKYHLEITQKALQHHFSAGALQTILAANINQDKAKYQFGHPHFHFDANAFDAGFAYIQQQEQFLMENISQGEYRSAQEALGRITHTWQDFYSHSNYIQLWLNDHLDARPEEIDPADQLYFSHPDLHSGNVYGLWDFIALVPGLTKIITPLMPDDSHAKMNLDSPDSGQLFVYNYHAAFKRTLLEFDRILRLCEESAISPIQIKRFQGTAQEEQV